MPVAEIISIGTELLLGEIQDTNTRYLARHLRDAGVDLFRTMIVGDNPDRISQALQEASERCQIILTTGGLGPTVDDPTRQAVAQAIGVPTEFIPALWDQIQDRFKQYGRLATENNKRQAYIPATAIPVENPVGTAPAFYVERTGFVIICLPGVPQEMEYIFDNAFLPYLRDHFQLHGTIKACVLHTAGMGESQIDELIGDLETEMNPTVGLLAHPGQCDVRVTAKAETETEADRLIAGMINRLQTLLGDAIYGKDLETLEQIILSICDRTSLKLAVLECGLGGSLADRLYHAGFDNRRVEVVSSPLNMDELILYSEKSRIKNAVDLFLAASLIPGSERQILVIHLITPWDTSSSTRYYGGPQSMSPLWAVNTALDYLRRKTIGHCLL